MDFKKLSEVHKALGNESRLKIVYKLYEKECSVTELTEFVELDQSTVSKHLSVLLNVGIVSNKKVKNVVFYSLQTPCIMDMFSCTTKVINGEDEPQKKCCK
ncbi:winged helix-turn-helix transcriptional regulator [bacterium]|nr:winged helix-turn-helix transcriptional regulator [bacterium]